MEPRLLQIRLDELASNRFHENSDLVKDSMPVPAFCISHGCPKPAVWTRTPAQVQHGDESLTQRVASPRSPEPEHRGFKTAVKRGKSAATFLCEIHVRTPKVRRSCSEGGGGGGALTAPLESRHCPEARSKARAGGKEAFTPARAAVDGRSALRASHLTSERRSKCGGT